MSSATVPTVTLDNQEVTRLVETLRHERQRLLEAVSEIDRALEKIDAKTASKDTEARRAEIAAVLTDVNQRYGGMFRRLAKGPET